MQLPLWMWDIGGIIKQVQEMEAEDTDLGITKT